MIKDYEDFIYSKKQVEVSKDTIEYSWYLIHRKSREGVHFHGVVGLKSSFRTANRYGFMAFGIEELCNFSRRSH